MRPAQRSKAPREQDTSAGHADKKSSPRVYLVARRIAAFIIGDYRGPPTRAPISLGARGISSDEHPRGSLATRSNFRASRVSGSLSYSVFCPSKLCISSGRQTLCASVPDVSPFERARKLLSAASLFFFGVTD